MDGNVNGLMNELMNGVMDRDRSMVVVMDGAAIENGSTCATPLIKDC